MTVKRGMIITLWILAAVFIFMAWQSDAFNNPNQGKYQSLIKKNKNLQESEVENTRATNPQRKASENKRPWLADSLLEMENLVFEPFDNPYGTGTGLMPWPKYVWPDGTRRNYRTDEMGGAFDIYAGCILSAPPTWDLPTKGETYVAHINIIYGIIRGFKIKGPATIGNVSGLDIPVHVYPNARDGTVITLTMFTVSVTTNPAGKRYGSCSAKTVIRNQPCECVNATPTIYASEGEILSPGSITLWVDSGGYACPPYTWTFSGAGFSLNKSKTENDLETVTLTAAGGACGPAGTDAVATIQVTDACGEINEIKIRNGDGHWDDENGGACGNYYTEVQYIYMNNAERLMIYYDSGLRAWCGMPISVSWISGTTYYGSPCSPAGCLKGFTAQHWGCP